jgi:hypothetical protein
MRDRRRTYYKARFWHIYAMSYHRAKRACQTETHFRMNLSRDNIMKWESHHLNTYTAVRVPELVSAGRRTYVRLVGYRTYCG